MTAWVLAPALVQLRNELNFLWPNRDHSSDGAIGDAAHAASPSDHNPNPQGVVCAYDIDTDLDGTDDSNDPEMDALVEWLRLHPHPNLKYVIYRRRIFRSYDKPGIPAFTWAAYTKDPHISHPHISVGVGSDGHSAPGTYDDTTPWLSGFGQQEDDDMIDPAKFDTVAWNVDDTHKSAGRMELMLWQLTHDAGADVDEEAIVASILKVLTPEALIAAIPAEIAQQVLDGLKARL